VGDAGAATALVGTMRADMTAIGAAAQAAAQKAGTKPRVFYDVGYIDTTGQIYGPAKGSFLAEMLDMLGVDVITGDATTYEIPLETLIQRDPQIIILGVNAFYKPTPAIIAKRTGWKALTAVKTGDIRSVTDTEITRPGPRLAIGMRNLALAMYPDLVHPIARPVGGTVAGNRWRPARFPRNSGRSAWPAGSGDVQGRSRWSVSACWPWPCWLG